MKFELYLELLFISFQSQNNSSSNANNSKVNEIDEALGIFFFGCNIPFNVVESIYFRKLITTLNPDYKLPTRKYLADALEYTVR